MTTFKQLFLAIMLLANLSPALSMETTFFNVGQGNGTVTTCPGKPTLLVDLGSSQHPADKNNKSLKDKIIDKVLERIESSDNYDLTIITSHPDFDHCNFVCKVAEKCIERGYTLNVLLGGKKAAYQNKEKEKLGAQFKALEEMCDEKNFTFKYCSEIDDFEEYCDQNLPDYCKILAAETGNKNPNDDSIIVRLEEDDFSVLFLGDTTDKVTKNLTKKELRSDVVLTSHHGAKTHKSTTEELMKKIRPKLIIFSAGMHSQYKHPQKATLCITVNYTTGDSRASETLSHCINYFASKDEKLVDQDESDNFKSIIKYENGAVTALTDHPIFSTTNEGDITISKKLLEKNKIKATHSSTAKNESERRTALNAINARYNFPMKTNLNPYSFSGITELFFTRLGIDDDCIEKFTLPPKLTLADFRENEFTVQGIVSFVELLAKHKISARILLETQYEESDTEGFEILEELKEMVKKKKIKERLLNFLERKRTNKQLETVAHIEEPTKEKAH